MKTTLNSLLFLMLFAPMWIFGQTTVKGTVTEQSSSQPLPGVNVLIKGTATGTATDFDGNYQINAKNGDVLIFSYVGYNNVEMTYTGQQTLDVQLTENTAQLDEVVVIGYGSTTKKDATGSVEAITSEDFTKGNIVTPENLLSGRIAGVSITTSGAPGSGSQIRIRGGSSINASNDPLIVIDGLPITNSGVQGSRGVLASINPNDIDSFSVLKDASATAIYGSRASNGVIIIVTKKGKSTFSASYDVQYSFGELTDRIDVFSGDEFRQLIASQPLNGTTINTSLLGTDSTNWQDEIFRQTTSTLHNVSLQGSLFKVLPARFSFGVANQEGAVLTSKFERRNLSLALNPTLFDDHLKVNINANLAYEDNRFGDSGQISAALQYDPTHPVFDPNSPFGGFYQHRTGNILASGGQNPVARLLQTNNTGDSERTYGNINLDYKFHFLPDLRAVLNLGIDETEGKTANFTSPLEASTNQFRGNRSFGFQKRTNKLFDGYLTYTKDFNKFNTEFTAGYSYQKFTFNGNDTGNALNPTSFASSFADPDVVLIGFFGRANFNVLDKYLLTFTYRRDGTSRFSNDNRWGNFPAAAVAWKISDEDFLKDSKVISSLKLRAGYGITGQQDVGEKDIFLSRFRGGNENSQYQFDNVPIQSLIASEVNPNLKWEETTTIELGFDYGLFNEKLTGSLNLFQKNSDDLLFVASVADGTNFSNSIIQNIGELQIQGLEFSLNADVIKKDDFNVNFNFNATFLDREITKLALGQDVRTGGIAGGTGNNIQLLRENEAPNSFSVFKQLYDSSGNAIEGAYVDLNGDNIINDDDRYLKENPGADVILGFQSTIDFKNFDLAFNLRANLGNYVYNNVNSSRAQYERILDNSVLANLPTSVLSTGFQRTSDVIISDIYVEDASFLKMDNITLGYTFKNVSSRNLKSIRLWGGVQNVFTITNYSGLDPEVFDGIDNIIYPRSRNILAGVNFKF
ncbi:MAG: SusC/RagA family TonB-linked outer membrane protein [Flavobacteriales bacterium]|nr:SusC/RagA family TonB-linked outer membrane protein [Flavobacteriia bacterium]NCP07103.1 SusC/RagA family TonB-linked outer membrane protein [Flavobacteriales bacterium]PIV92855.1 MAG: SusC/RagA family TonB-linked outer membrane protein [Flavobacteriaceae bacterium CG17_big_fil_post_rev_8_21_14_2_50_33_15]NCP60677.1 SusC/RagA family TonB-linked outer membrane protein [Flavobacteriales bacterium]NCQ15478.1 SusC/RagA family TonB-linked outer membrane protein [Flavobacteriales bacterium]